MTKRDDYGSPFAIFLLRAALLEAGSRGGKSHVVLPPRARGLELFEGAVAPASL